MFLRRSRSIVLEPLAGAGPCFEPLESRLLLAAAVVVDTGTVDFTATTNAATTANAIAFGAPLRSPIFDTVSTFPLDLAPPPIFSSALIGVGNPVVVQPRPVDFVSATNLVSDGFVPAGTVDLNLKNPWGLAPSQGLFWAANNGSALVTSYDSAGRPQVTPLNLPGAGGQVAAPTAAVANPTTGFTITAGGASGPATLLFVGQDGGISGWNPQVSASSALLAADHSATGAVYTGATLGQIGPATFLYVANFHAGTIDVFDSTFAPVVLPGPGAFTDTQLPGGFAPFNIQNLGGKLYVTFARQDTQKRNAVPGLGEGFVDVFDTSGHLLQRFAKSFALNAPWGLALAPGTWRTFAGDILVGQHGNGTIAAFNPLTGNLVGLVPDRTGNPFTADGLWSLQFGTGLPVQQPLSDPSVLFFTAGLNQGKDGLFGELNLVHAVPVTINAATGNPIGFDTAGGVVTLSTG